MRWGQEAAQGTALRADSPRQAQCPTVLEILAGTEDSWFQSLKSMKLSSN